MAVETLQADVAIVGGGMVGAALACALAEQGFAVALLERREPQREWPAEEVDMRVSALTRASQRVFENLGVWQRMCEMRVSPYQRMQVWDAQGFGRIGFDCAELGEPDLGHIVENRVIQLALWEKAETLDGVSILCPAEVSELDLDADKPELLLADGRRIEAALVAAADGRDSRLREMAGVGTRGWSYDQHAIVATVTPEKFHQHTAWQRFMPTGPLAFLPIDDGRCSIVWSTSPQEAKRLTALDEAAFCRELTAASEGVLGEVKDCGPRGVFPLRLQHTDPYVLPGFAMVGDAAHAIHPLAGQGVNLGLLDAATLAEVLVQARDAGRRLGCLDTLRRYERARKGANMGMLAAMDGFKRLFSNHNAPLRLLRNIGLTLTDRAGPVKGLIVRRAMGLAGELPALARFGRRAG